jgi:hypothetical protein
MKLLSGIICLALLILTPANLKAWEIGTPPNSILKIQFKRHTIVKNKYGKTISGVLGVDRVLKIPGGKTVVFKQGKKITFDKYGKVTSGTLYKLTCLTPPGWGTRTLKFAPATYVEFDEKGHVKKGTLYNITYLLPPAWNSSISKGVPFKALGEVTFDKNGRVTSGYLNWAYTFIDTNGRRVRKNQCNFVSFAPNGRLISK